MRAVSLLAFASLLGYVRGEVDRGCNSQPYFVHPTPGRTEDGEEASQNTIIYCDWTDAGLPNEADDNPYAMFTVAGDDYLNKVVLPNGEFSETDFIQDQVSIILSTNSYELNAELESDRLKLVSPAGLLINEYNVVEPAIEPVIEMHWRNPDCATFVGQQHYMCFMLIDTDECHEPAGNIVLSRAQCVYIDVVEAPADIFYGCTDYLAINFDEIANAACEVDGEANGCCEYMGVNEPPLWVYPETYGDYTHFDVCDYDQHDPRTGQEWAIQNNWNRWNTVDGITFDLMVTDYNNGDLVEISFDCDLSSSSAQLNNRDCPIPGSHKDTVLTNYMENQGGDDEDLDLIAFRSVHWDLTHNDVHQCHNPYLWETDAGDGLEYEHDNFGSHQINVNQFQASAIDNSDLNTGTEPKTPFDVTATPTLTYTAIVRVPPTIWFEGDLANGDDIFVDVGCSVDFTVQAHDCNDEDTVSLYVLEDPGLPNGATVSQIQNIFNGQVNSPQSSAERSFSWTPTIEQAGKTYAVCFIARDDSDICELNGWYSRDEICVEITVSSPLGMEWTNTENNGATFETTVGCSTSINVGASETNNYCAEMSLDTVSYISNTFTGTEMPITYDASANVVVSGSVRGTEMPILTVGDCQDGTTGESCLGCGSEESRVGGSECTREVTHTPIRGQEGSSMTACFHAADVYGFNYISGFCTTFLTRRCRYCVAAGDMLHSLSADFALDTNWLRLWNFNGADDGDTNTHTITNPDMIYPTGADQEQGSETNDIHVGNVYNVQQGDTPKSIANRFRTTSQNIMSLNPDVALDLSNDESALVIGQPLCLHPCHESISKPTYSWGY